MLIKIVLVICVVSNILLANKFIIKNDFITKLHPIDKSISKSHSGNVIQGITSFEDVWIVTQTHKNEFLILNILNNNGKSIFNTRINYPSHGQDLSYIFNKRDDTLSLFTTANKRKGVVKLIFKYDKKLKLIKYKELKLETKYGTPAISENKKFLVTRNGKYIEVYSYSCLSNGNKERLFKFKLSKDQSKKGQYFQGIVMKDNLIYALTGNSKPSYNHYLYVYDLNGKIKYNTILTPGKEHTSKEGNKYELEGLTFKENNLYTTVMTGKKGKNIKRLYKILRVSN